jgi:uncharacterized protein involved in exopolysaccharide biosynthesis
MISSSSAEPRPEPGTPEPEEPTFFDFFVALGQYRRMLVVTPLVAGVIAAIVALLLPKTYTATARILPPQQNQGVAAALLSQSGLAGAASLAGGALGLKNPSDLYIGMLKSNTVADALIERFRLLDVYGKRYLVDARKILAKDSDITSDKGGIISIEVDARDPQLAANLANAYVEKLHDLMGTLALTEAAQRRVFLEGQLQQAKDKLADAEIKLRAAIGSGGLVSVDAQGEALVDTVARIRAQISVAEIEISAMRAYATPDNPDMQRAQNELAGLKKELARLESGSSRGAGPPPPDEANPPRGVDNIRLFREVKYYEQLFVVLAKQYELARADEARDAPAVQVLDRASAPEKKSGPPRALIVLVAMCLAFFGAACVGLVRADLAADGGPGGRRARLALLLRSWGLSRRVR